MIINKFVAIEAGSLSRRLFVDAGYVTESGPFTLSSLTSFKQRQMIQVL